VEVVVQEVGSFLEVLGVLVVLLVHFLLVVH